MRTLYFDCQMGAAGDMLTAALLELIPDRDRFVERFNKVEGKAVAAHEGRAFGEVRCPRDPRDDHGER